MIFGFIAATALQLFAVGSDADIRAAAAMASECGVHSEVRKLKTSPALYVEKDALKDFQSPQLQCFFDKLFAHKFSADFGFIGNDAARAES